MSRKHEKCKKHSKQRSIFEINILYDNLITSIKELPLWFLSL